MWSNLAKGLGATDINATLEKIGNAVAPREEDYSDDDEYYDDDEYEDEEGEYSDEDKGNIGTSPFRLAGILTRALDADRPQMEERSTQDEDSYNNPWFPRMDGFELVNESPPKELTPQIESAQTNDFSMATTAVPQASIELKVAPSNEWDESPDIKEDIALPTTVKTDDSPTIVATVQSEEAKFSDDEIDVTSDVVTTTDKPRVSSSAAFTEESSPTDVVAASEALPSGTTSLSRQPSKTLNVALTTDVSVPEAIGTSTTATTNHTECKPKHIKTVEEETKNSIFPNAATHSAEDINPPLISQEIRHDDHDVKKETSNKEFSPESQKATNDVVSNGTSSEHRTSANAPEDFVDVQQSLTETQSSDPVPSVEDTAGFRELQLQLEGAKQEIEILKKRGLEDKQEAESERDALIAQFHAKETRLLQATTEENQNQTRLLEQQYSAKMQNLEQLREKEKKESQDELDEYKKMLRESYLKLDRTENQLQASVAKYENEIAQAKKQEERALRKVDDRMAQSMAILDERNEEIARLKKSIKSMESKVTEHKEGEEEAEEELEELHQENDSLRETIETLQSETKRLKEQVGALKSGSQDVSALQMELTLLKEELVRERTKNQVAVDSASVSRAQVESERDTALSEVNDAKQQLAAAQADLEIARSDNSRMLMANTNLQSALEAFQDERHAEMELIEEQRRESEEAIKAAHATANNALKQIHETEMYELQKASDAAVKNVMEEMDLVQAMVQKLQSENNQMRRSLDEAIHRLQTTQEDVIDRNVMKNILVDWCTLNDKNKRHQVLEVMANLLHFSEDEKEKVHLTSKNLDSVRAKVVGALAAPLPPSKADVEHLEGSNVHEKWVNFLMAETDDL